MGIGASIFLVAVGAILAFAVTADVQGIDIATVGWILMIVGIVGFLLSLIFWSTWGGVGPGGANGRSPGSVQPASLLEADSLSSLPVGGLRSASRLSGSRTKTGTHRVPAVLDHEKGAARSDEARRPAPVPRRSGSG